jgi:arylsulfatase A-like enzyme
MDREVLKSVNGRFKDRLTSPTPEQVAALKALYKDEVLAAYRFFATTSQMLAGENILNKNALFLLTADHGERFFEHGSWLHAEPDVYNEVLAIPMMIKGAGFPAGRFRENVQLADIFPTIMEWLGDQKRQEMNGFSLLQLFSGDAADHFKNRVIYADGAKQPLLYSAIIGNLKIIVKGDNTEVYDLKTDPGETTNLAARKEFAAVIQVARGFRDNVKTRGKKKKQTVSEAELQRLKSLGYID